MLLSTIGATAMAVGYGVRLGRHANPKLGLYIIETFVSA
jgi:hypothetical protein